MSFRAAERNLFQRPSKTIILHKDINPSTFPFYQCRWRRCPPRQRPKEAGRYARPTTDIRLRWHPVCTYLLWNHRQLQVHSFWAALCCHSERSEESAVESRYKEWGWCFRSFAAAQDDKEVAAQDDKEVTAQDDKEVTAQDDKKRLRLWPQETGFVQDRTADSEQSRFVSY